MKEYDNLIREFNKLPALKRIETERERAEFIAHPFDYLDRRVVEDTGITYSDKVKASPEQLAELAGIPYVQFVRRIGNTLFNLKVL
jgi:hypothetical protein